MTIQYKQEPVLETGSLCVKMVPKGAIHCRLILVYS